VKFKIVLGMVFSFVALSLLCTAQESKYKTGKIVSIRLVQSDAQAARQPDPSSGQTDAPLKGDSAKKYEVVVDVNGTSYVCRFLTQSELDSAWMTGKEVQVRVKDDVIHIKNASGKDERLSIVSRKSNG